MARAAKCKEITFSARSVAAAERACLSMRGSERALARCMDGARRKKVVVTRCRDKSLKAHNRRQCRRGGKGWRNARRKDAALFTKC